MSEVPSPYLPGTQIQIAWDSTSLGYLKTCPRLYQLTMIEGWTPKDDSIHLRFGIEYHKALEEYDGFKLSGSTHDDALGECVRLLLHRVRDWDVDTSHRPGNYKNPRSVVQLVIDYLDHYKDDPATTVIREDGSPATELSFRFELDWGPAYAYQILNAQTKELIGKADEPAQPYLLCGHLDRVVTFNDSIFVMDHKTTTAAVSPYFFDQWSPSNQMTLYTIAGQVVLNAPIKGVILDAAGVLIEKPNDFKRGFTFRTPDQLSEWLVDLKYWLTMAEGYANMSYWPMNDTSCDKFGGCKFRGVCSKDPAVRDRFLEADFVKQPPEERWNPLKPR
jgi:hypothetical protein